MFWLIRGINLNFKNQNVALSSLMMNWCDSSVLCCSFFFLSHIEKKQASEQCSAMWYIFSTTFNFLWHLVLKIWISTTCLIFPFSIPIIYCSVELKPMIVVCIAHMVIRSCQYVFSFSEKWFYILQGEKTNK